MAKNKSLIVFEGSLGDLSFYNSVFGPIVRRKGGPDKRKIKTAKSMVRVREQNSEFGNATKAAKLLRNSLRLKPKGIIDHSITWRINKLMNQVKNCDTISVRGKRNVSKGFVNAAGKKLIQGFDVTEKAKYGEVLARPAMINVSNKSISINSLVPCRDIKYPKGASHVRLRGTYVKIDFNKEKFELKESADVVLSLKSKTSANIVLQMNSVALNTGFDLYYLYVEFLQEVNSTYYDLENKQHNCLNIVEVI